MRTVDREARVHTVPMPESTQVALARNAGPCVHLFWTGGWDSTFQLLQLLLRHRVPVVPHYLEDATRASTRTELRTMHAIGDHLRRTFPHTDGLLRPAQVAAVRDVRPDPDIAAALREVRTRSYIGDQYAWLPAFCRQHDIVGMELGVHVDDKVQALLRPMAAEFTHVGGYRSVRVDPMHAGTAEFTLFGSFGFPLFHLDKVAMDQHAHAEGWDAVMDMTWFCHRPVRGSPCGVCAPCVYTIEEGLARRIPPRRRLLSFFFRHLALPLKGPLRDMRASLRAK